MKTLHIHEKSFCDKELNGLVIGGQNNADTIRFIVPKTYANEVDLSIYQWYITYENKEGTGDTVSLSSSPSPSSPDSLIYIDWKPSATATQISGKLMCQLYAIYNDSRFYTKAFPVYVEPCLNPEPITQALPSVIEQALEIMASYDKDIKYAIEVGEKAAEEAIKAENSANAAKDWAIKTDGPVENTELSAKQHAINAGVSETNAAKSEENAASSEEKATEAASLAEEAKKRVDEAETRINNAESVFNLYYQGKVDSFDKHAEQKTSDFDNNAESQIQLAKDWASKMDSPVEEELYSSRYYASQAAESEMSAADSATSANKAKEAAGNSASTASEKAEEATNSASEANSSKEAASKSATDAADSASTAEAKAEEAKEYASNASASEANAKEYSSEAKEAANSVKAELYLKRKNTPEAIAASTFDIICPVGSIFMNAEGLLPQEHYSKFFDIPPTVQWEKIMGRVLIGDTLDPATGQYVEITDESGNKGTFVLKQIGGEIAHLITILEMASHSHRIVLPRRFSSEVADSSSIIGGETMLFDSKVATFTDSTGGNQPHENMQPYLSISMWMRTI